MTLPRLFPVLAVFAAALTGCDSGPAPAGGTGSTVARADLNGQGATFVEPIMKVWTNQYLEKTGEKVRVNYQGTGSGAGVTQMTKKTADFGCSDAPMNKSQTDAARDAGGPVIHVPLVIGAVVPMYNLPGVDQQLTFSGPVLADVFTGTIRKWNDAKLKALNPGVTLPDLDIQPVYRSDPSGTSFIFSDYLAKVSGEFKEKVGASTTPKWPEKVGIKQNKSDGVAGHIERTAGAIGYIELTFALDTKSKFGAVTNKAGKAVAASLDSITAAASATLGVKQTAEPYSLHELTYNLTDAPGDASYPIAGMSFAVLYQKQPDDKGTALVQFLKWATGSEGQEMARQRNFAPLPAGLQVKCVAMLDTVEYVK